MRILDRFVGTLSKARDEYKTFEEKNLKVVKRNESDKICCFYIDKNNFQNNNSGFWQKYSAQISSKVEAGAGSLEKWDTLEDHHREKSLSI